jgi:hypothetical protein
MSLTLTGTASNITTPLGVTITALSNNGSGAVRVTTSAPHLFGNGDSVTIATSPVSGTFTITVIDSTHFDLNGSTYISTATGSATDNSLTPQILVPTDGDTFSQQLSGALSSVQSLCDRTQFLQNEIVTIQGAPETLHAFQFKTGLSTSTVSLATPSQGQVTQLITTAPHYLQTGMWVNIAGGSGDTTINGNWPVTVLTSNDFSIPVAGSGSYAANSATVTPIVPPGVTAMILDGWGGGGGGEQGGGYTTLADGQNVSKGPFVAGGGGAGARRKVVTTPVTPLASILITQGAGGAGGSGSSVYPAGPGTDGGDTIVTLGSFSVYFKGGRGAGAGQATYPQVVGYTSFVEDAIIAPGASGDGPGQTTYSRPWTNYAGIPAALTGYVSTSTTSNIGNFIDESEGSGGAAVVVYPSSSSVHYPTKPSTPGMGQGIQVGGIAGARGTDSGSGPVYLGGPGGGGGGAGPGGAGGAGGAGSNGNNSGNSTNGSAGAAGGAAAGWTGAGGGGGGSAGGASGTTGNGGNGGAGDGGAVTLLWVK